jgi:uncharacterized membrane protein
MNRSLARRLGAALLVSLAMLPILPQLSALVPAFEPVERIASTWLGLHCHRDPARTPAWLGVPLAACARCSGIYFGLGLGALLRRPQRTGSRARLWLLGAAALMLLDIALEQYAGVMFGGAWRRMLTGMLLGFPAGALFASAVLIETRAPASHSPYTTPSDG